MALHKDATGADLHEPKGISAASSGEVYVADGAGSGVWEELVIPSGTFLVTVTSFTASGTWTKPSNLFAAKVWVVGSGGTGWAGAGTGPTGGTVSFGSHLSATGGGGGGTGSTGGAGGTGSSGNVNLTGFTAVTPATGYNGIGADSGAPFGIYGRGSDSTSIDGRGGGGGGSSFKWIAEASLGATETVTLNTTGANNGLVVVEEYIQVV